MLRIFQSQSLDAAKAYYASGLREGDYYAQEGQGIWRGKAAAMLKLGGEVTLDQFTSLCENRRPDSSEKLNPREDLDRKVGYDMTFSVPKSVSIMYEIMGDRRILGVFHQAVRETMQILEEDAHVRVRRDGEVSQRRTGNLVWAEFTHHVTRPVDGLSDPSLHCHCYCFNTSFDSEEKRFKSGEFFHIKRDAPYYEAIFHSKLSMGLRKLGYGIEAKRLGFEIMGIGEGNLRQFSRRTQEIEEMAELLGISGNAKAKDSLGSRTRVSKNNALKGGAMRQEWRQRIDRRALNYQTHYGKCTGRKAEEAVELAIDTGLERESVIQHRRLLAQALKFSLGSCSLEDIQHTVESRRDLICHEQNGAIYTTTEAVLQEERSILAFLETTKGLSEPLVGSGQFDGVGLDGDQSGAVQAILSTKDRVIVVEGRAGTGKTSMMKAAVSAMETAGWNVFTFAPTSQAAHEVLKGEGFLNSETVQQLLVSEKLQQAIKGGVLWVDEAGLFSVGEMNRLFQIAEEQGARVILSGDRFQHHSIQRGDALRLIVNSGLVEVKQTRTIYRQRRDFYRNAVKAISDGNVEHGLHLLDQFGVIHESVGFEEQCQQVADDYVSSLTRHSSVLVVSPTHFEGRMVTRQIRELLKLSGRLADEEVLMPVHRNRNLTAVERAMPQFLAVGDIVRFHQNAKGGCRKGDVFVIRGIEERNVVISRQDGRKETKSGRRNRHAGNEELTICGYPETSCWEKCFMEESMRRAARSAYDAGGKRKYLTKEEGLAFMRCSSELDHSRRLLCETIYFTGCRLSEALALTFEDVDVTQSTVLIRCLKKRGKVVVRRIPVPVSLSRGLGGMAASGNHERLWGCSRTTGWRIVKRVMEQAGIKGIHATAKGLRHGFGVRSALGKVPGHVIQRWMGHSDPSTTAIYLEVHDDEERQLIRRTW